MEASVPSTARPEVAKVPYEKVSAGETQDGLRHRLECSERELAELEERTREVAAVHDACVAALGKFHGGVVEAEVVDAESREAEHRQLLELRAAQAALAADEARRQARDWEAVREAADAGLKALQERSGQDGGSRAMIVEIEVTDPDLSGTPGRARELLAERIGWKRVRKLFPKKGAAR